MAAVIASTMRNRFHRALAVGDAGSKTDGE
jgi:hypothetical protein